jgi:hypothetical protein
MRQEVGCWTNGQHSRSVKQEDIYDQDYADGLAAQRGLAHWFGR